VQFVQVLDASRLRVEIWERGAGYTLASGSSACAAAGVAHRLGLCGPHVEVLMPGGALRIELTPAFDARMTGGVTRVAVGVLAAEAFEPAAS
jgi:diaminopimelate epimerase